MSSYRASVKRPGFPSGRGRPAKRTRNVICTPSPEPQQGSTSDSSELTEQSEGDEISDDAMQIEAAVDNLVAAPGTGTVLVAAQPASNALTTVAGVPRGALSPGDYSGHLPRQALDAVAHSMVRFEQVPTPVTPPPALVFHSDPSTPAAHIAAFSPVPPAPIQHPDSFGTALAPAFVLAPTPATNPPGTPSIAEQRLANEGGHISAGSLPPPIHPVNVEHAPASIPAPGAPTFLPAPAALISLPSALPNVVSPVAADIATRNSTAGGPSSFAPIAQVVATPLPHQAVSTVAVVSHPTPAPLTPNIASPVDAPGLPGNGTATAGSAGTANSHPQVSTIQAGQMAVPFVPTSIVQAAQLQAGQVPHVQAVPGPVAGLATGNVAVAAGATLSGDVALPSAPTPVVQAGPLAVQPVQGPVAALAAGDVALALGPTQVTIGHPGQGNVQGAAVAAGQPLPAAPGPPAPTAGGAPATPVPGGQVPPDPATQLALTRAVAAGLTNNRVAFATAVEIERFTTISLYEDANRVTFPLHRLPLDSTWGLPTTFNDMSSTLCLRGTSRAITLNVVGELSRLALVGPGGEPIPRATVHLVPLNPACRAAGEQQSLAHSNPASPAQIEYWGPGQLRGMAWTAGYGQPAAHFTRIYDARQRLRSKSVMNVLPAAALNVHDIVMVEFRIRRYRVNTAAAAPGTQGRPTTARAAGWNTWVAYHELVAINLLQNAPANLPALTNLADADGGEVDL